VSDLGRSRTGVGQPSVSLLHPTKPTAHLRWANPTPFSASSGQPSSIWSMQGHGPHLGWSRWSLLAGSCLFFSDLRSTEMGERGEPGRVIVSGKGRERKGERKMVEVKSPMPAPPPAHLVSFFLSLSVCCTAPSFRFIRDDR
jgi:hypothetical protein